jgi:hypothetical protein
VLDRLRALFASSAEVSDVIAPLGLGAATQRAVLDRSNEKSFIFCSRMGMALA